MTSAWSGDSLFSAWRSEFRLAFLLQHDLRIVRGIRDGRRNLLVQFRLDPAAARRERLVAGDRQQPGRHRRACLEGAGLAPDVEEHVAQEIFGQRFVVNQSQQPAIQRDPVPTEQGAHGELVAAGDPHDQRLVGRSFGSSFAGNRMRG